MFFGLFRRKENTGTEVTLRQENSTVWVDAPKTLHCRVKVFDLGGKKVMHSSFYTNIAIGLWYLPKGIYTLKIVTEDGYICRKQIVIGIEL